MKPIVDSISLISRTEVRLTSCNTQVIAQQSIVFGETYSASKALIPPFSNINILFLYDYGYCTSDALQLFGYHLSLGHRK